jgi:hypothetical protein
MFYAIQNFLLIADLIKKKEWGYILIVSLLLTPISGLILFIFYWIKTYNRWKDES